MYYGLVGVAGIAFACSTELIPEINEKLRLVPFTDAFKWTMTVTMALDYAACYIIEIVLKWAFSDYKPKDIAIRRPDQDKREQERNEREADEAEKAQAEKLEAQLRERIAAAERRQ